MFKSAVRSLPDVNCAHDVATATREVRITREVDSVLRPQIVVETEIAMKRGHFDTWLTRHNEGLMPESIVTAINWLKENGYNAYLKSNPYGCHCSAHIGWSWANKVQRLQSGDGSVRTVLIPQLEPEKVYATHS